MGCPPIASREREYRWSRSELDLRAWRTLDPTFHPLTPPARGLRNERQCFGFAGLQNCSEGRDTGSVRRRLHLQLGDCAYIDRYKRAIRVRQFMSDSRRDKNIAE